ncbi:MAG: hypothetical protein HGA66_19075, partial [Holophaga sp.]|nr:hypothetical protein [Holophaga sp.]
MPYTREELDWMEAEWAFHLHGRQAWGDSRLYRNLLAVQLRAHPAHHVLHNPGKGYRVGELPGVGLGRGPKLPEQIVDLENL